MWQITFDLIILHFWHTSCSCLVKVRHLTVCNNLWTFSTNPSGCSTQQCLPLVKQLFYLDVLLYQSYRNAFPFQTSALSFSRFLVSLAVKQHNSGHIPPSTASQPCQLIWEFVVGKCLVRVARTNEHHTVSDVLNWNPRHSLVFSHDFIQCKSVKRHWWLQQCTASNQITLYLSNAPNTTGVVDLTVKCLLTSPSPTMQF